LPDFSWQNIPKWGKIYLIAAKLPNGHKMYQMDVIYQFQMAIEYIPTFSIWNKALQNLPKLEFFVWKYTIWQPWALLPFLHKNTKLEKPLRYSCCIKYKWYILCKKGTTYEDTKTVTYSLEKTHLAVDEKFAWKDKTGLEKLALR
jgi:hypothetical protein